MDDPRKRSLPPIEERIETEQEKIIEGLDILEDDVWSLVEGLRQTQDAIRRLFSFREKFTGR